jgi:hypothetical protein
MSYVASRYAASASAGLEAGFDISVVNSAPDDCFKVQSWFLYGLALFARLECNEGAMILSQSINLARRLGLYSEAGIGLLPPLLQESCRRTWWEMYSLINLIRSMMDIPVHMDMSGCDLRLPGQCEFYERCEPSPPQGTLQEMQDRVFFDTPVIWSAFAYKVDATRILQMVLDSEQRGQGQFQACQSAISNWWLSLPIEMRDATNKHGDIDECMFFAQMLMNMASLRINLPRSGIATSFKAATLCSALGVQKSSVNAEYHTQVALKAANNLSTLIAAEGSVKLHSPCSTCAVAFGTIVQLPAYLHLQQHDQDKAFALKENIQLGLSYLKRMGEVWPLAFVVKGQLAGLARDVLVAPRRPEIGMIPTPPSVAPVTQPGMSGEKWLTFAGDLLTDGMVFPPLDSQHALIDPGLTENWLHDLVEIPAEYTNMMASIA